MIFTKEEMNLNRTVVELMEMDEKDQGGMKILYKDFLPVVINKKALISVTARTMNYDKSSYVTFRPCVNGRHVQLLIDFMYLNDDDVIGEIVSLKREDGSYLAIIRDNESNDLMQVEGSTETEAKFRLFYKYYLEEDCEKELKIIRKNEEKNRAYMNAKKEEQQAKSKNNKKKGRK